MYRLGSLLRSRIALRIVVLFVLCAMVPVVILTAVVYRQLTGSLREQSQRRLHEVARTVGMEVLERLRLADAELRLLETFITRADAADSLPAHVQARLAERFSHVAVRSAGGETRWLTGQALELAPLSADAIRGLDEGLTVLTTQARPGAAPRIVVRRRPGALAGGELIAVAADGFLWGGSLIPPWASLVAFGPGKVPLVQLPAGRGRDLPPGFDGVAESGVGQFEWEQDGEVYLAAYWSVGLRSDFRASPWTFAVSQPRSDALAPMASAGTTIVFVSLASLLTVMLLSLVQVRRSLVPLTRLQEGTRRVGVGDFDQDVELTSGDEFQELAGSFNSMAHRLKRQFHTLSARGELDRAVLSSLDAEAIVRTLLDHLPELVECDHVAAMLVDRDPCAAVGVFWRSGPAGLIETAAAPPFSADDVRALSTADTALALDRRSGVPAYLDAMHHVAWETCLVVPIVFAGRLAGLLVIGDSARRDRSPGDVQQVQQLGNQLAVALSNADLVQALDRLNVGTLRALARTVDAKSPWTAGHSQRVMEQALVIGREMGLPADTLDTIERGALLHDIGKIAVPSAILNKPGPLTPDEVRLLQEHPATGARILDPIPEYGRLIPIVLQHHEWYDGRGYPAGLAGEAISLDARVVAVADVFDALTSLRPYRKAMDLQQAIDIICAGSGTQFDPAVVEAFRRLHAAAGHPVRPSHDPAELTAALK